MYSCLCFVSRFCPSKKQIYQSDLHFVENLAVKVVAQVIAQKHWETCPTCILALHWCHSASSLCYNPARSGILRYHSCSFPFIPVSFRSIPESFRLAPAYPILFQSHFAFLRHIPFLFRYIPFRSIPFLCFVTPHFE